MNGSLAARTSLDDLNAAIALFAGTLWPLPVNEGSRQSRPERGAARHLTLVHSRPSVEEPWATAEPIAD
jgi:hypothetical protein